MASSSFLPGDFCPSDAYIPSLPILANPITAPLVAESALAVMSNG
jgi:hypothetical protein